MVKKLSDKKKSLKKSWGGNKPKSKTLKKKGGCACWGSTKSPSVKKAGFLGFGGQRRRNKRNDGKSKKSAYVSPKSVDIIQQKVDSPLTMSAQRIPIKNQDGGAYVYVPSFAGNVTEGNNAMDAFNQDAGTLADMTTATNQLPTRLGADL